MPDEAAAHLLLAVFVLAILLGGILAACFGGKEDDEA